MIAPRVLVIGYGNRLRRDDAVGWHAADGAEAVLDAGLARVERCHQLQPELAEDLSTCSLVVFVDARAGGVPGTIRCERVEPAPAAGVLPHHVTPASLVGLVDQLWGRHPSAVLVSVSAGSLDSGESLTREVASAVPGVVARIRRVVEGHVGSGP